jgi:hypothetical protein
VRDVTLFAACKFGHLLRVFVLFETLLYFLSANNYNANFNVGTIQTKSSVLSVGVLTTFKTTLVRSTLHNVLVINSAATDYIINKMIRPKKYYVKPEI